LLYFDKLLAQLAYPLGLSILLIAFGALLIARSRRRSGLGAILFGLAWLWLWSLPAVSDRVRASLESRFENRPAASLPSADAIVVLGGGEQATPPDWPYPGLERGADRIWHAARLFHAERAATIIVAGGRLDWWGNRRSGAEAMREFLVALDVPKTAIVMESSSRNTRENAVRTAEIARERGIERIVLVTSALHMRRALATFENAGLTVLPAATDFEVVPEPFHILRWLPDSEALDGSTRAIKEYLGYAVYRWRGWID
jgi:uncharacterized SAM-binding protein YcdF (DUF218 family)